MWVKKELRDMGQGIAYVVICLVDPVKVELQLSAITTNPLPCTLTKRICFTDRGCNAKLLYLTEPATTLVYYNNAYSSRPVLFLAYKHATKVVKIRLRHPKKQCNFYNSLIINQLTFCKNNFAKVRKYLFCIQVQQVTDVSVAR